MQRGGGLYETDYGPAISFTYSSQEGGVTDVAANRATLSITGNTLHVEALGSYAVEAVTMLGTVKPLAAGLVGAADIDLSLLPSGIYVIRVKAANATTTAKFLK